TAYSTVVWIAYLAPGLTTFLALARVLGSGWLALPGAVLALTPSARLAGGVEGGGDGGGLGAGLAGGLAAVPALARARGGAWIEERGRPSRGGALIIAAIVLTHPAALPAAVTLIVLAALARPPRGVRLAQALTILALAAALTAFWTLPLMLRIENTRALAWG